MEELYQTALEYHKAGLQLLPIQYKSKVPCGKWKDLQYKPESIDYITNNFQQNINIGIICGQISGNFFVLDYDNGKIFDRIYSKYNSFQKIVDNTPLVETKRGYHLYLRYKEPIQKNKNTNLDIDIQGQGSYVIAPPSLHPDNYKPYLFQDSFKAIYELQDLQEIEFIDLRSYIATPKTIIPKQTKIIIPNQFTTFGLSHKLWDCLKNNNYDKHGYKSRSESEMAIVLRLMALGWTAYEIEQLFSRLGHPELKAKSRNNYVTKYCYPNAVKYYQNNVSENVKTILTELLPIANTLKYTDKAVYTSIIRIGQSANITTNINLPLRRIAIESNLNIKTIHNSLKRLITQDLIIKLKKNRYKLNLNVISKRVHINTRLNSLIHSTIGIKNLVDNYKKDIYTTAGLNKNGIEIIKILNDTYTDQKFKNIITVQQIQGITGISYNTIKKKLRLLEKNDLVKSSKEGRVTYYYVENKITDIELDNLATKLNVTGITEKRINKIQKQQKDYKEYVKNKKNKRAF